MVFSYAIEVGLCHLCSQNLLPKSYSFAISGLGVHSVSPDIGPVGIGVGIRINYHNVFTIVYSPLYNIEGGSSLLDHLHAVTQTYASVGPLSPAE